MVSILGARRVSWREYGCCLAHVLVHMDRMSALMFCSLGTCVSAKELSKVDSYLTFFKCFSRCGSLFWKSLAILLVTNLELLSTLRSWTPTSLPSCIPTVNASSSSWSLLALKYKQCYFSMSMPLGPSKVIPTPLPIEVWGSVNWKSPQGRLDFCCWGRYFHYEVWEDLSFYASSCCEGDVIFWQFNWPGHHPSN